MNQKRPINLDLASMKYPPMAIASILHRMSGILLFLLFPFILYYLNRSLQGAASFEELKVMLSTPLHKALFWAFSAAAAYHMLAGFRHLLMDVGFGEQLAQGRRSAIVVITLGIILTIFIGIWLW